MSILHRLINNFEQRSTKGYNQVVCDSQLQMQNQQPHQVIVFEDEDPDLSLQSGEEIPPSFNHRLPQEMELVDQSDGISDSVEIVDPFTTINHDPRQPEAPNNYYSAPIHQQSQELPEPASDFVFAEENAFSFRNPQQQLTKKQSHIQSDVKISSGIQSQTDKEGELAQKESTEGRSNNRRLSQNRSKSRFHDISDQESVSHHKLANKADHFKQAKIFTPNLFNRNEQEQQQIQQQSHKTEGHMTETYNKYQKFEGIRQTKVAQIKKNKLPPLSEPKGQIQIMNSSATQIGADSSMLVLDPKSNEKNRLPMMDSYAQMLNQTEQPKLNWIKMRVPAGKTSRCIFSREKLCCSNFYNPEYSILLKDMTFLITAKKEFGHLNSYYTISMNEKQFDSNGKGCVGFLKGNFVGTKFDLFEKKGGKDDLVCTITYKAELSCSPAYRVMEIYIRSRAIPYSDLFGVEQNGSLDLHQLYQMGENAALGHIVKLINKKPEWSDIHDCYVLNLRGKSRMGSVKNMVLIDQTKPNVDVMLFCKTQKHEFHLEINNPLSPFITMGILLSSFDFKLFCQ